MDPGVPSQGLPDSEPFSLANTVVRFGASDFISLGLVPLFYVLILLVLQGLVEKNKLVWG